MTSSINEISNQFVPPPPSPTPHYSGWDCQSPPPPGWDTIPTFLLRSKIRKNWGSPNGDQSHKKRKLSGQQDFCRKNFPDKARKSRQFSNPQQMRIKGGYAKFWIIQLHFLDDLESLQIVRKLSRSSGNFPDHTDTVLDHPNSLQIIWTHF